MQFDKQGLIRVINAALYTQPREIGCDECFEHMDHYAELLRRGQDPDQVLPLVHEHLQRCPNCREEFEVLLAALEAANIAEDD